MGWGIVRVEVFYGLNYWTGSCVIYKYMIARKRHFSKINFSDWLKTFFSESPYQNKLTEPYQFFRKWGHSLTDWYRLKVRAFKGRNGHFFYWRPFLLKIVPFSQFRTNFNILNTHFLEFFMLYANKKTIIRKKNVWPFQSINLWVWSRRPKLKIVYSSPTEASYEIIIVPNSCSFRNKITLVV